MLNADSFSSYDCDYKKNENENLLQKLEWHSYALKIPSVNCEGFHTPKPNLSKKSSGWIDDSLSVFCTNSNPHQNSFLIRFKARHTKIDVFLVIFVLKLTYFSYRIELIRLLSKILKCLGCSLLLFSSLCFSKLIYELPSSSHEPLHRQFELQ